MIISVSVILLKEKKEKKNEIYSTKNLIFIYFQSDIGIDFEVNEKVRNVRKRDCTKDIK